MTKKRIIILGAGLAGLSAAWHLQRKGIDCIVFEKEAEIGGLCRSKKIGGFTFDYDGHLLHFKHRYTFDLIKKLLGDNLAKHKRNAWIYSFGKYTPYPFQANLYGLPTPIIKECILGLILPSRHSGFAKNETANFLDWIHRHFGQGIARHFMIPYNRKFWTIPLKKITCEWVNSFIPLPSLDQIIEGSMRESKRQFGYNVIFWYPKKGGINLLPLAFGERIKNIHTNCQITAINLKKRQIEIASGGRERFDYLVSSIPLPELPCLIKDIPRGVSLAFKKLRWTSIFNLNLGIDSNGFGGKHWTYFPQKEISFFRVGFPHNFSPSIIPQGKSSLYIEVAYSKSKPIAKSIIASRIIEDLKNVGMLTKNNKIYVQDRNDIKYAYPIYDQNYGPARTKILEYLMSNGIVSCGRYGSWSYMSMEESILDARAAVKKIK